MNNALSVPQPEDMPISDIRGGSNMTGTNCDLFTQNQSRSYLNHLVCDGALSVCRPTASCI
jgi:hypothetical protein